MHRLRHQRRRRRPAVAGASTAVPNRDAGRTDQADRERTGTRRSRSSFSAPGDGGRPITGYTATCTSSNGGTDGSQAARARRSSSPGSPTPRATRARSSPPTRNGPGPASPASDAVTPSTKPAAPVAAHGRGRERADQGHLRRAGRRRQPHHRLHRQVHVEQRWRDRPENRHRHLDHRHRPDERQDLHVHGVRDERERRQPDRRRRQTPWCRTTSPIAPVQPSATAGNAKISVAFTAPGNGGSAIAGYTASCTSSNGGTPGARRREHRHPGHRGGLTNGKTYTAPSPPRTATATGPASPASGPVTPSTVPGRTGSADGRGRRHEDHVSFSAPFEWRARPSPATRQRARRPTAAASASATGAHSPIAVTGLTNDKTYACTVTASNANGAGGRSAASGKVVPASRPRHRWRTVSACSPVTAACSRSAPTGNYGSAAGRRAAPRRRHDRDSPATRATGSSRPTAASSASATRDFYGSTGAIHLNQPIVGMTADTDRQRLLARRSDGGIFSFGDAHFYGSTGAIRLNQPIVGMAATPTGHGYWMVATRRRHLHFGDAHFYGSAAGFRRGCTSSAWPPPRSGHGYWIAAADGAVLPFGDRAAARRRRDCRRRALAGPRHREHADRKRATGSRRVTAACSRSATRRTSVGPDR